MLDIQSLKKTKHSIIALGSHPAIIQSMLDFDYLTGQISPSVKAIIAGGRRYEKYFFGKKEVLIPLYTTVDEVLSEIKDEITLFINLVSGRRVLASTVEALETFPKLLGGAIFAENVPEAHSLKIYEEARKQKKFVIGPSSVGLVIPGIVKLGAIGGIEPQQLIEAQLFETGKIAAFSASGGMTNELITSLTRLGKGISFSLSFGGDRFPCLTPKEAFMAAQNDEDTEAIVYFGELGGYDEYEVADLLKEKKITKKVIAYIAGTISEMFETPPQFGHAKAMAGRQAESASQKRDALREAGAISPDTFDEFIQELSKLPDIPVKQNQKKYTILETMTDRHHSLFSSSISGEKEDEVYILGEDLISFSKDRSFAAIVASLLLGKKVVSKEFESFVDHVLKVLVDHGPYQSGAVNTMVTARAGRDLVSSLTAGLLTIGPRFGGAINEAAGNWLKAVAKNTSPTEFVESFAREKKYIPGIGHKKYRIDTPDPRVKDLLAFTDNLEKKQFTKFAQEVEKITTSKKGNLILNVDGTIAAVLLDLLHEKEGMSLDQLQELVKIEFFNALFILSRSVGFTAHFLDQKRLDEGLFRLSTDDVASVER